MGTDLVTVLGKMKAFKDEAKYWFQCIGIECPSEFNEETAKMEEFLKELGSFKGIGAGVGADSKKESK